MGFPSENAIVRLTYLSNENCALYGGSPLKTANLPRGINRLRAGRGLCYRGTAQRSDQGSQAIFQGGKMSKVKTSGKGLGWFLTAMLMLSSQAWGLDLDHVIAQNEADSAQILSTLGRDKGANAATSKKTHKLVQVKLLKKTKTRKHR